jgi:hypothetical protein
VEQQVKHIQTAIGGRTPDPEKLHLANFTIKFNKANQPVKITCPNGQTEPVHPSNQRQSRADEGSLSNNGAGKKTLIAHFNAEVCANCPLLDQCPTQPGTRDPRCRVRFTQADAHASERRRRSQEHQKEGRNLRAAIEASMGSIKHPICPSLLRCYNRNTFSRK